MKRLDSVAGRLHFSVLAIIGFISAVIVPITFFFLVIASEENSSTYHLREKIPEFIIGFLVNFFMVYAFVFFSLRLSKVEVIDKKIILELSEYDINDIQEVVEYSVMTFTICCLVIKGGKYYFIPKEYISRRLIYRTSNNYCNKIVSELSCIVKGKS